MAVTWVTITYCSPRTQSASFSRLSAARASCNCARLEMESDQLRQAFRSGRTRSVEWRIQQLKSIAKMVQERESEISQALYQDLGKSSYEAYVGELSFISQACKLAVNNLKNWMSPRKVSTSLVSFPARAEIVPEPLGVALIIASWNFPFVISVDPMVGAIAAGNAVLLKPSELAPATSALLAKLVPEYLDTSAIKVVEGGIPETTSLLNQPWDKIFYTGSSRVGKIVMAAAAKHLTPVVLELGGKCPVLVDSTVDLKATAKRIAFGKWANNNGQACISPDYVLAEESAVPKLVNALKECLLEFFPADTHRSRIVNSGHFGRLTGLLDEPAVKDTVVYGGERDETKLYIAPTLLLDPSLDSAIMSEEVFGPLLPIIKVDSIDHAIEVVNSRPKPLALYVFTHDKSVQRKVVNETSAGGVVVNDTMLHFANPTLPFGGVGESGMGAYHGKFSFDAFSHDKPVLYRSFWGDLDAKYPPYDKKKQGIVRSILEGDYVSLIKTMFGLQ